MRTRAVILAAAVVPALILPGTRGQDRPLPKLVSSDIDNFWRAYDAGTPGNRAEAFQRFYFDAGSPGLKDFIKARITSAEELAKTVDENPKFYSSIRRTTAQVAASGRQFSGTWRDIRNCIRRQDFPRSISSWGG